MNYKLTYSPEVQQAKANGDPIVALESTIISHGLPYPENVKMVEDVSAIIRQHGAVPATMAILGGEIRVGITPDELDHLAKAKGIVKTSVRDLPVIAAKKQDGATTVASTMTIAAWAGVDIFVTGGIGGVHREASETFDISADLPTLGRVRVGVVCAGAKSILDVPATLEYLETQSVPVLGYKTDVFPGFYIRNTGLPVLARVDTPEEAAAVLQAKKDMDLPGSVLYTVPIPAEFEVPEAVHEKALELILREAKEQGIRGKDVTPFILARFREETGGEALAANLALVKNNAQVGADIAVALKRLQK